MKESQLTFREKCCQGTFILTFSVMSLPEDINISVYIIEIEILESI